MDTLTEILSDINKDINAVMKHKDNNYFRNFMNTAYLPTHKLPLPEGDPPYNPQKIESGQQTKGIIWQFLRKVDTLRRPELKEIRREVMFIDILENVTEEEAKLFLAMKDQNVKSIYPNITLEKLVEVGYFVQG